jgi:hypothetical protein
MEAEGPHMDVEVAVVAVVGGTELGEMVLADQRENVGRNGSMGRLDEYVVMALLHNHLVFVSEEADVAY